MYRDVVAYLKRTSPGLYRMAKDYEYVHRVLFLDQLAYELYGNYGHVLPLQLSRSSRKPTPTRKLAKWFLGKAVREGYLKQTDTEIYCYPETEREYIRRVFSGKVPPLSFREVGKQTSTKIIPAPIKQVNYKLRDYPRGESRESWWEVGEKRRRVLNGKVPRSWDSYSRDYDPLVKNYKAHHMPFNIAKRILPPEQKLILARHRRWDSMFTPQAEPSKDDNLLEINKRKFSRSWRPEGREDINRPVVKVDKPVCNRIKSGIFYRTVND